MIKVLVIFSILMLLVTDTAFAKKASRTKSKRSVASISNIKKKTKSKKKKRRRSFGPDLKKITIESEYTEAPNNGINPIELN